MMVTLELVFLIIGGLHMLKCWCLGSTTFIPSPSLLLLFSNTLCPQLHLFLVGSYLFLMVVAFFYARNFLLLKFGDNSPFPCFLTWDKVSFFSPPFSCMLWLNFKDDTSCNNSGLWVKKYLLKILPRAFLKLAYRHGLEGSSQSNFQLPINPFSWLSHSSINSNLMYNTLNINVQ